ncbi:MAG: hypothetical protein PQJ58_00985 [Spirochaetales bacterium]|nr:hypothetical protein [Spirochaetales bacterium]
MGRKGQTGVMKSLFLWICAILITGLYVVYENDPYDPLKVEQSFSDGSTVTGELIRSKVIGRDLVIALDTAASVTGYVEYRRVDSDDQWTTVQMDRRILKPAGHGGKSREAGKEMLAASLPSLDKMAGKYMYLIHLDNRGESLVITDRKGNPLISRYRGSVPAWVLIPHILFIMLSMLLGVRAALEVLSRSGDAIPLMWFTIVTLILGGFVFGPLMQYYAFGVLWSGIPLGWDLTDNKVVLELIVWLVAVYCNTGKRKGSPWSSRSIAFAGILTILIYLIPHSLFGSAYNYSTGSGTGTST